MHLPDLNTHFLSYGPGTLHLPDPDTEISLVSSLHVVVEFNAVALCRRRNQGRRERGLDALVDVQEQVVTWDAMTRDALVDCWSFYILATSKVISVWALTCDSAHSWELYSAVRLGDQTASTMTRYPTQSHYPDTEPTSPCLTLIMLSACLGSNKYQFLSHWFYSAKVQTHEDRISRFPKMGDECSTHSDWS